MYVAGFAGDESLVRFDVAGEFLERAFVKREPELRGPSIISGEADFMAFILLRKAILG